jgi:hypothetical protein
MQKNSTKYTKSNFLANQSSNKFIINYNLFVVRVSHCLTHGFKAVPDEALGIRT